MNVIIVSGAEATCKSDIAKRLATELHYSYYSKDIIKEAMFDQLGQEHSTWNYLWYESKAKDVFFDEIKKLVDTNRDMILETNFKGKDKEVLQNIIDHSADIREIHCYTRGLISFRRAVRRNESGRRHPGHHDRRWYPKVFIQSLLRTVGVRIGAHKPVGIGPHLLELDTSKYPDLDFNQVVAFTK